MGNYKRRDLLVMYANGHELLRLISVRRNVDMKSILGRYNYKYLVDIRKEFCREASAMGLGSVIIGKILHRSQWTVLYHLNSEMRARKALQRPRYYLKVCADENAIASVDNI